MNISKKHFLFFLLLFQSCGHPAQAILEDTFDENTSPLSLNTNSQSGPCQDFIQAIVSFEPGEWAGYGQSSMPDIVLGPPRGNENTSLGGLHALSLGDHGRIIVDTFPCEIVDEEGVDFIVFENPFLIGGNPENPFAEVATVSVSSDGENFTTFSCEAGGYPYTGCAGWRPVLSHPENGIDPFDIEQAGGDPFDLAEIGIDQARYVLIEDISGGGFPPSMGFDLDALVVVHGLRTE